MADARITAELLAKYDRPGPRYTSYPTVPEWREDFDSEAHKTALQEAKHSDAHVSLYTHIPFCKSRCAYCGCNVTVSDGETVEHYLDCLRKEISLVAQILGTGRQVTQCHWGGGTPTCLNETQMQQLFSHLASTFNFSRNAEIAIETNPSSVTESQLRCLAGMGFNRISFGVQDLDPAVQQAICRNQTDTQTRAAIDLCRNLGFRGINVDLIYGLPLQQEQGWMQTIEKIVDMKPDRIAIYSYAHLPARFPHQVPLDKLLRPDAAQKYSLFALARQHLLDAGYMAIGMDHFAQPDDELAMALSKGKLNRNFMGYTVQQVPDQVGFGASAISEIADRYIQNIKEPDAYCQALKMDRLPTERGLCLSRDDVIRRWVIRKLMCSFVLDKDAFNNTFGVAFDEYFREESERLKYFEEEEMVVFGDRQVTITPLGFVFIRNICMEFDAYLTAQKKEIFSRTI